MARSKMSGGLKQGTGDNSAAATRRVRSAVKGAPDINALQQPRGDVPKTLKTGAMSQGSGAQAMAFQGTAGRTGKALPQGGKRSTLTSGVGKR